MSLTALASPSSLPVPSPGEADPADLRVVRFNNECVLIPEQNRKRSRVVTRSYSLPLWRRRAQIGDSESAESAPPSPVTPLTESDDAHIVLKVPLPSFIVRGSSRGRSPSASPRAPLSPCLVHRSPSSSPALPAPPKPSLVIGKPSLPSNHPRKGDPIVTVPLRACCPNCVPITEESMREGEQWKVRFTRGARRRRSASLDSTTTRPPSRDGSLARHGITVDEVDKHKRQRSLDLTEEDSRRYKSSLHPPGYMDAKYPTVSYPSTCSRSASNSPNLASHQTARASPIQEEDEDQLFPLPSPRCTPNASPSPSLNSDLSPKPSPVPSRSSSLRCTPTPSPNASTSCITSVPTNSVTLSDDSILAQSLSRKVLKLEVPNTESSNGMRALVLNERTNISRSPSPSIRCRATLDPIAPPISPSTLASPRGSSTSLKRSPSISQKKRFTLPFFKSGVDSLKGASVDVLKGVGMGGTVHHLG